MTLFPKCSDGYYLMQKIDLCTLHRSTVARKSGKRPFPYYKLRRKNKYDKAATV